MVNLINLFKKEDHRWYRLDQLLKHYFSKIKEDIHNLSLWIHHFKEKHDHNEYHHYIFNEELKYHKSMIFHLHKKVDNLKNELETLKLEKGQVRTSQGQVKDMSPETKDMPKIEKTTKTPQETKVIDKESLAGSHIELLNLLYHSDKPLAYEDISRILGKKEKSVRNLVYELREKGTTIHDKQIGIRKKGFFLPSEEKIRVSGR